VQSIRAPTLVLQGNHDEVVKFNVAEYYRDHIPNAKLVVIENASHSISEVPEEVANDIKIHFLTLNKIMETTTKIVHAAIVQYQRWYLYERDFET
jgi:dipeptidyl aminopeptidase/acylaminoacyl peptidase